MENPIIQRSKNFIQQLFEEKLSKDFLFHDLDHTESVREFSIQIGTEIGLSQEDLEVLDIASWFHDAGYTELYTGHESASCTIVEAFLKGEDYPADRILLILECIKATKTNYVPQTLLQKIIKDADLSNLGMVTFHELSIKLRHEWDVICGNQYTDLEWLENNLSFLGNHTFYTKEARRMWSKGKERNLAKMKELVQIAKKLETKGDKTSEL